MAADAAADELVFAMRRMNNVHNPKLYTAPSKVERSTEERITSNLGDAPTTARPGGIAGAGIAVLAQVSGHHHNRDVPAPPPET